ncbi:MAG: hypothetical protein GTN81_07105 [Proteobacteria bacterium]|nr:hypothetical protein [Pseudomonadota bacterium]
MARLIGRRDIVRPLPPGGMGARCGMALGSSARDGNNSAAEFGRARGTVALLTKGKVLLRHRPVQGRVGKGNNVRRTCSGAAGMTAGAGAVGVGKIGRETAWRTGIWPGGISRHVVTYGASGVP